MLKFSQVEDADAERERAMAERQVTHLARLVDDLMDISRINRGKIELRKELVELAAIVDPGHGGREVVARRARAHLERHPGRWCDPPGGRSDAARAGLRKSAQQRHQVHPTGGGSPSPSSATRTRPRCSCGSRTPASASSRRCSSKSSACSCRPANIRATRTAAWGSA